MSIWSNLFGNDQIEPVIPQRKPMTIPPEPEQPAVDADYIQISDDIYVSKDCNKVFYRSNDTFIMIGDLQS